MSLLNVEDGTVARRFFVVVEKDQSLLEYRFLRVRGKESQGLGLCQVEVRVQRDLC